MHRRTEKAPCSLGLTVRPQPGTTIHKVVGRDREEYVVSVPCQIDGRIGHELLAIAVGSAEAAKAWAAAANAGTAETTSTSAGDNWGPWIAWSGGSSCPVPLGTFVQVEKEHHGRRCRAELRIEATAFNSGIWRARSPFGEVPMVLRYRVRAPRGMSLLRRPLTASSIGYAEAPNKRPPTRNPDAADGKA